MLEISRPHVATDSITDFPLEERFITLPIQRYLKLLGAWDEINAPQIALINAVNDPRFRFITAAFSRRLGKTYISNIIAQLVLLIPNLNILIISPNYSLSSISFELQRQFIGKFDLEVARNNLKDKVIELSNGSSVRMGSLSTVDGCVGRSYKLILFDEAALGSGGEEAFNVQLRPTLDKMNSKAIFISTPRGKLNWFSRFFARGYDPMFPEWCSMKADYLENSRTSEKDIEEARRSMSKAEFEQEYMANFGVFEGQIYSFDMADCVEYHVDHVAGRLDGVEVIAGCDPGYRHPTAFVVIVYDSYSETFHIVDEYLANEGTTPVHAAAFSLLIDKWGVEVVFIDPAAAQFAGDLAYVYDISTTKAKKDVLAGIAYVGAIIETHRLKIAPHCVHCLAAVDQYRWDERGSEKPNHDYSDMLDAVRYAIYTYTL